MKYRSGSKGEVEIEKMIEPHLLNAIDKIRRRLNTNPNRPEQEIQYDIKVLAEMVRVADERGWGRSVKNGNPGTR